MASLGLRKDEIEPQLQALPFPAGDLDFNCSMVTPGSGRQPASQLSVRRCSGTVNNDIQSDEDRKTVAIGGGGTMRIYSAMSLFVRPDTGIGNVRLP